MRISHRLRLYGMKLYDLPRHKAARLLIAMWKSNADPTLPRTRLAAGWLVRDTLMGVL